MSSLDRIHVNQILYTKDGERVIVVRVANGKIDVNYKGKEYTRDISIIGDKLFVKAPSENNTSQKNQQDNSTVSSFSGKEQMSPPANSTEALVREIIYGEKTEPQNKARHDLLISNDMRSKSFQAHINKAEHHELQKTKIYSYRGDYINTIDTSEVKKPKVRGGWTSNYQLQYPQNSRSSSAEGIDRSDDFLKEAVILGKNSGFTEIRPSTKKGYSQQKREPIISKKRKHR